MEREEVGCRREVGCERKGRPANEEMSVPICRHLIKITRPHQVER